RRSRHPERPCLGLFHTGLPGEQHPGPSEGHESVEGARVPPVSAKRRRRPRQPVTIRSALAAAVQLAHLTQDPGGLRQPELLRILAIDPGSVRLGLALSDPSGTIAQPPSVLSRRSEAEDLKALVDLVARHDVEAIVIGLPRLMDGRLEAAAQEAQAFGSRVEQATGRPVAYWDERLTTVAAERYLIEQGKRRSKRRQEVDRMAATLLLQGYLDYQRGRGPRRRGRALGCVQWFVVILFLLPAALGIPGVLAYNWVDHQLHTPANPANAKVRFVVPPGASFHEVADTLHRVGLIDSVPVF